MNVKEVIGNLGTNEWLATAGSVAAFAGLTWYGKRWLAKRRKDKEEREIASAQMGISPEQLLQMVAVIKSVENKPQVNKEVTAPYEAIELVAALAECHKKQSSNTKALERLQKDVEAIKKAIGIPVNKETESKKEEKVPEVSQEKIEELKAAVEGAATDGLDPLMAGELNKIQALTVEGKEGELLARLNVIPNILPDGLSISSIGNIREMILFSMMCRNKLLGTTLCIPRDKASDYLVEAHRNVMDLLREDGFYSQQLEHAFSRFFSFLKDDSNFKMNQNMQKRA